LFRTRDLFTDIDFHKGASSKRRDTTWHKLPEKDQELSAQAETRFDICMFSKVQIARWEASIVVWMRGSGDVPRIFYGVAGWR
jgi:hypothetical protein